MYASVSYQVGRRSRVCVVWSMGLVAQQQKAPDRRRDPWCTWPGFRRGDSTHCTVAANCQGPNPRGPTIVPPLGRRHPSLCTEYNVTQPLIAAPTRRKWGGFSPDGLLPQTSHHIPQKSMPSPDSRQAYMGGHHAPASCRRKILKGGDDLSPVDRIVLPFSYPFPYQQLLPP